MRHLKSFMIYGATIFFNAAISFATFSLLTHHLSDTDYGIINLYGSSLLLLIPFIGVGVQYALSVDYFRQSHEAYRKHFTNALLIPAATCLLFTLVLLLFHAPVVRFIHASFFFVLLLPLTGFLTIMNDIMLSLIRNKEKHLLFAGYSIAKNVLEIGLTLLFILALSYRWEGRLGSTLLTLTAFLLVSVLLIRRWRLYGGGWDKAEVKKLFVAGLPFVPERLAIFVLMYSDRFFINYYEGTDDVGSYSAGAQIAIIVNLLILTLNNTFYPVLFRKLSLPEIDRNEIRKVCYAFVGISAVLTVCVILAIPFIFELFIGPEFQSGQRYAVNLTIANFFWSVYSLFLGFLLSYKKNRLIMSISIFGMIVSLILNFFNVRLFGALGATYTGMIVYFIMGLTAFYFSNRLSGLYRLRKPLVPPHQQQV
jgi:O-antigen/teichoic acid export membrane protein